MCTLPVHRNADESLHERLCFVLQTIYSMFSDPHHPPFSLWSFSFVYPFYYCQNHCVYRCFFSPDLHIQYACLQRLSTLLITIYFPDVFLCCDTSYFNIRYHLIPYIICRIFQWHFVSNAEIAVYIEIESIPSWKFCVCVEAYEKCMC